MDWDKLKAFHAVADAGSFTRAGEALNLSQPALSRRIQLLEESLEVSLFHRHPRGVILTEQGELLYQTVKEILAKLAMAQTLIDESKDQPKGILRITTTAAFGACWLTPLIVRFLEQQPQVSVRLILGHHHLDLAMGEADVAIRMRFPEQPDLIQRRLMTVECRAFASASYLKAHGEPATLQDLDRHRLIAYGDSGRRSASPPLNWLLSADRAEGEERRPALEINGLHGIYRAVERGFGIAVLPSFMRDETRRLVPVLKDVPAPIFEVYFVYPAELRHSKRIAVFRDYLLGEIAKTVDRTASPPATARGHTDRKAPKSG
jgi:DNA-binding transcriptional LysR family regulator